MSPKTTKNDEAGSERELTSAWELDKKYGQRVDQAFALNERFMLLAAKIEDETIATDFGDAEHATFLVQRLDPAGVPTGIPFKCGTLASAIVEKVKAAGPDDFPAIVQLEAVTSKRFKKPALVMSYVGATDVGELAAEFGLDAANVDRMLDTARPEGQRLPAGY